jgi:outer membrane protein assembly factor BamB
MFSLGSILSSPAVSEGTLFVGSTDGHVYALR